MKTILIDSDVLIEVSRGRGAAVSILAATATVHGAALWTRNRKRYPMPEVEFF